MSRIAHSQAGLQGDLELRSRSQDFANSLIQMLQDPDTGVAASAADGLLCASSSAHGGPLPTYASDLQLQQIGLVHA